MSWEVKHVAKVGMLPHLMRALHYIAVSMIDDGSHPGDTTIFANADPAYYVERDGKIVAVMIYDHIEAAGYTWVSLSWTHPAWRRKGLHRALTANVEAAAREKGSAYVCRSVAIGNLPMHKAMTAEGYTQKRITYERYL